MEKKKKTFIEKFLEKYSKFEQIIAMILTLFIAMIVIISIVRIGQNFVDLFIRDIFRPEQITFEDYQVIFGKIMTLLISLEFMSSILKVLKTHDIKTLIQDVVLITALAIARKLIIFDYEHHEPVSIIVFGGLLVSIGVFYFLISYEKK